MIRYQESSYPLPFQTIHLPGPDSRPTEGERLGMGGLTDSPDHSFPSSKRYRSSGSAMQDGALPSRRMKGKRPEGQHTEQSALWKPKKKKNDKSCEVLGRYGKKRKWERSGRQPGSGGEAVVRGTMAVCKGAGSWAGLTRLFLLLLCG